MKTILPRAFSLVEVALAIGIVAFAFVALLGVLPAGLETNRAAIDSSIHAQITQELCAQVQRSSFADLANEQFARQFPVYYDDQGIRSPGPGIYSIRLEDRKPPTLPSAPDNPELLTLQFVVETQHRPAAKRRFSVTTARKEEQP